MKIRDTIKGYILANFDQAGMFSFYLGLSYIEVVECLNNQNKLVINPLRHEQNPSMGFMWKGDKIYAKDFGNDAYSGDIFHLVGVTIGENCNSPTGFINICNHIIRTYRGKKRVVSTKKSIYSNETTFIEVERRDWTDKDKEFWLNGNIPFAFLDFRHVYPVNRAWINDVAVPYYIHSPYDIAYAYFFGREGKLNLFKLYFPYRTTRKDRFRTNNRLAIEAGYQIKPADTLVLTKSYKDKIVIENALARKGRFQDLCVMSLSSEGVVLPKEQIDALRDIFPRILLNLDYDKQGITTGYLYKVLYNIDTIFLPQTEGQPPFNLDEVSAAVTRARVIDDELPMSSFTDYVQSIDKSTIYYGKDFYDIALIDFDYAVKTINKLL